MLSTIVVLSLVLISGLIGGYLCSVSRKKKVIDRLSIKSSDFQVMKGELEEQMNLNYVISKRIVALETEIAMLKEKNRLLEETRLDIMHESYEHILKERISGE